MSQSEEKVRSYILQNFLFSNDPALLNSADSLMQKGIIDSTGVMEMIFFLQDEFGVTVADHEMIPDNLDSVNNIVAYINRKQQVAVA